MKPDAGQIGSNATVLQNSAILNIARLLTHQHTPEKIKSFQEIQQMLAKKKKIIPFTHFLDVVDQRIERTYTHIKLNPTSAKTSQLNEDVTNDIKYCLECIKESRSNKNKEPYKGFGFKKNCRSLLNLEVENFHHIEKMEGLESSESEIELIESRVILDPEDYQQHSYQVLNRSKINRRNLIRNSSITSREVPLKSSNDKIPKASIVTGTSMGIDSLFETSTVPNSACRSHYMNSSATPLQTKSSNGKIPKVYTVTGTSMGKDRLFATNKVPNSVNRSHYMNSFATPPQTKTSHVKIPKVVPVTGTSIGSDSLYESWYTLWREQMNHIDMHMRMSRF